MHPCIPRKCIQPSLRQPHSCRMLDSANSSLPFLLPFPRAHATNQLHTNARLVRGDPPWTRNARRFPNSFAREFFFQSFQIFLSFFLSSSLQSINGKLSELFLRNFNFLLVQLLFKFWRELDGEFGTESLVTVVPAERGNSRRDNAFNNQCPVARTSMTGISVVIGV